MNSWTRVLLVAAASASLGLAGYRLLTLGPQPAGVPLQPIPLRTNLGPVTLLPEPKCPPYALLIEQALVRGPQPDAEGRKQLVDRLRQLRDDWRGERAVAAVAPPGETSPDAPDRL